MKNKLFLIICLLLSLGLTAQDKNLSKLMQERNEYYFTFELNGNDNLQQIAHTISVDRVDGNVVTAYANNKAFAEFQKMGYEITLQTPPSMQFEAEMWDGSNRAAYDWDHYPTYPAYEAMMYQFATDHPDKCEIIELGTLPSNRKILIAHINNGSGAGKPKFLYTSTIHGDETTGWMLMLRMIDYILENPTLPECANVLENIDLYVGPNTNPDGTYHGGNNTVNGATRANANGVDMNRNYADPHEGPHPDGNAYQQETQWFMQFAEDNNFVMGANYHGGAEVMNYPWDNTYTLHSDDAWYQLISHEYADLCHQVSSSYMTDYNNGITNGASWYMIGGGRQDYMNGYAQCREMTIECSNTKCPDASQMPNFWNINKEAIFAFMNQVIYGIHGTVVDAESKAPIEGATITLTGHDDQYSTVSSQSITGEFHRPVKGGTYILKITKDGYKPYTSKVTVADYQTLTIDAELTIPQSIYAEFSSDIIETTLGGTVHYTDESWDPQAISSWSWEFEGGTPTTSTAQNPTVTYNEAGLFGVRLTVTNANGQSDTKYWPNYINVYEAYNMQNGTITTCDAMFYDDGGPANSYGNNKNLTMTFLPATAGGQIEVEFQSFVTENNWDFLYIYDGTTIDAPQIGQYTGSNGPGTVAATNADGALTFKFTSDGSATQSGWEAHVRCLGVVTPMVVDVVADHETICVGESMTLHAYVTGGEEPFSYVWDDPYGYLDDVNAAEPVVTPTEAGQYAYVVTVYDNMQNVAYGEVFFEVEECQSVDEVIDENVSVYPNPTSSVITINGLSEYKNLEINLVNIQGQVVISVVNSLEINVKDIESGIYFLNINCDGTQIIRKIVVE